MKNNLDIDEKYCDNCRKYKCICYAREMWRMILVILAIILIFALGVFIQSLIWTFK